MSSGVPVGRVAAAVVLASVVTAGPRKLLA